MLSRSTRKYVKNLCLTVGILFVIQFLYRLQSPFVGDAVTGVYGSTMTGILSGRSNGSGIFAIGITPYITASIVIELLTILIPSLQTASQSGLLGKEKIKRLTMVVGGVIAFAEALIMAVLYSKNGFLVGSGFWCLLGATLLWTAAAFTLMLVGEFITNKLKTGNGLSLMLTFNVLSYVGTDFDAWLSGFGEQPVLSIVYPCVFVILFFTAVSLNAAENKIPIINSRVILDGEQSYLPVRYNIGGVMPVMLAMSIMSILPMIATAFQMTGNFYTVSRFFNMSDWFSIEEPIFTVGVIPFVLLIFGFSYVYSLSMFNTDEIADNLKQSGTAISDVKSGTETGAFLKRIVRASLWKGTAVLTAIVIIPVAFSGIMGASFSFGGTAVIIVTSTVLEMFNRFKSETTQYRRLVK